MTIRVEAKDEDGWIGFESIEIARPIDLETTRHGDGSDADHVGAWERRHVFGTKLGPNRNGRKW